jgi:hypothetical protein
VDLCPKVENWISLQSPVLSCRENRGCFRGDWGQRRPIRTARLSDTAAGTNGLKIERTSTYNCLAELHNGGCRRTSITKSAPTLSPTHFIWTHAGGRRDGEWGILETFGSAVMSPKSFLFNRNKLLKLKWNADTGIKFYRGRTITSQWTLGSWFSALCYHSMVFLRCPAVNSERELNGIVRLPAFRLLRDER